MSDCLISQTMPSDNTQKLLFFFFHIFIAPLSSCGLCSLVSAASWFCFILYIFRLLFPLIPFAVLFGSLTCPSPWTNAAIRKIIKNYERPLYTFLYFVVSTWLFCIMEKTSAHTAQPSLYSWMILITSNDGVYSMIWNWNWSLYMHFLLLLVWVFGSAGINIVSHPLARSLYIREN